MNSLYYAFLALAFLALLGSVIWLLRIIFFTRDDREDNPLALNFLAKRGKGNFILEELKRESGKNGRIIAVGSPKDLPPNYKEEIKNENVIVDRNKLLTIPKGALSTYKNINIYLPADQSDIDSSIKDTVLGKGILFMSGLKDVEKTVEDILREGVIRRDQLLKKIGDGEISKDFIQFQEGLVQDYLTKIVSPPNVKEKSSSITSIGTGTSPNN